MKIIEANGARIPALGLGTWNLRGEECSAIVEQALQTGYRHIDTAIMYENESAVGTGIRDSGIARDEIFLTTKVWPEDVLEGAFERSVEASLSRLGVDRVDLLLIHWPPKTGNETVWAGLLDKAVNNGWTRHVGVSNFTTGMLDKMMATLNHPLVCNQVENHPFIDQSKVRTACARHGIALIAYCPLFRGGDLFSAEPIVAAAERHVRSPAQIVLRWHVQKDGAGAIPKTATPSRLSENIAIFDFELDAAEMRAIDALTQRHERICDFAFSPQWDTR